MSIQAQIWAKGQKGLNSGAKFVLWVLADYADARGASCFPSVESIADDTAQGYRTVLRHLEDLEAIGLIERFRERREDGTLGRYSYVLKLPHANLAHGTTCQKQQKPHANLASLSNDEPPCEPPLHTHTTRVRAIDVLENVKAFALGLGFTEAELPIELESIDTLWQASGKAHKTMPDTEAQVRRLLRHQATRLSKRPRPIASEGGAASKAEQEAVKLRFGAIVPEHERAAWEEICSRLPKPAVRNWLAPCLFSGFDRIGCMELYAPTPFVADHITTHLTIEIEKHAEAVLGRKMRLRVAKILPSTNQTERTEKHEFA